MRAAPQTCWPLLGGGGGGCWLDTPLQPGSLRGSLPRGRGGGQRPGPQCGDARCAVVSACVDMAPAGVSLSADLLMKVGAWLRAAGEQPADHWVETGSEKKSALRLRRGRLRSHFSLR